MKQVFRLMGMPDRVLAFDELPARLLVGLEMTRADGFPRHWKEWMGKTKRTIRVQQEKNPLTGQMTTYKPIEEEDCFFYLIDWNIRIQEDRWEEIKKYVKTHAPVDMRLPDKLEDLAVPLAKDKLEAVSLEPEDMPVIPLSPDISLVKPSGEPVEKTSEIKMYKCEEKDCGREFDDKRGIRMHRMKKHPEPVKV